MCRGCILVGPSRFLSFFFFTREKRSPCSCQKRTRPTRPCTHVCQTRARQLLRVNSVTVSSFETNQPWIISHQTSSLSWWKNVRCWISKVAMGNECGGLSVDCRWSLSAYSGSNKVQIYPIQISFSYFFISSDIGNLLLIKHFQMIFKFVKKFKKRCCTLDRTCWNFYISTSAIKVYVFSFKCIHKIKTVTVQLNWIVCYAFFFFFFF